MILEEGMPEKPKDANHALFIGATLGSMMRYGMNVAPVVDEDGDYTDGIRLILPDFPDASVVVIVPQPAPGWQVTDTIPEPAPPA
jgi:hypothetical protein